MLISPVLYGSGPSRWSILRLQLLKLMTLSNCMIKFRNISELFLKVSCSG